MRPRALGLGLQVQEARQLLAIGGGAQALGEHIRQLVRSLDEHWAIDIASDTIAQVVSSTQDVFGFTEGHRIVRKIDGRLVVKE